MTLSGVSLFDGEHRAHHEDIEAAGGVGGLDGLVDVKTVGGAVGDGVADDTQAILDTIEACLSGGSVYFPPGKYKVTETIDLSDYTNIHFIGGNLGFRNVDTGVGVTGFINGAFTPAVVIDGSTITDGPVFYANRGGSTAIHVWDNLMVNAGKTGWHYHEAANVKFRNASAACVADEDGDADNCALLVVNSFWFWFEGSGFQSPTDTKPAVILRGESPVINAAACGLMRFRDCTFWLGGVEYQQNVDPPTSGNVEFHNCLTESTNTPFFKIVQSGFSSSWNLRAVRLQNCEQADHNGDPDDHSLVVIDAADCNLIAPVIESCGSPTGRAIEVTAGSVRGARIGGWFGTGQARYQATSAGVSSGASVTFKATGVDIAGDDSANETEAQFLTHDGALIRHMRPADTHFRFGLSSTGKHLWGPGTGAYDTTIERSAANVVALGSNDALKTGVAAHGSLPAATGYAAGSQFYCTTDSQPLWSNGTTWREADGTEH
jgi:hypothetical protein